MDNDERLQRYLALCNRMYERMRREGSWPWREGAGKAGQPSAERRVVHTPDGASRERTW